MIGARLQGYIDVTALLLLVVANTMPVISSRLLRHRLEAPIDAGRSIGDRRILGAHKTWRGFVAGMIGAGIAGMILRRGFAVGAAFGALALLGDLLSSFIKRRLALGSGHRAPLLDQLPEALLPLIAMMRILGTTPAEIVGTTLAFVALDALTEQLRPPEQPRDSSRDAHRV